MTTKAQPKTKTAIDVGKAQASYTIETRRALHRIPELGWEETKTIAYIEKQIDQLLPLIPFDATKRIYEGGICIDIDVHESLNRILFRADIDGLPIEEKTKLDFASEHEGVMHACGHDCHSAMLLGALRGLATGVEPTSNLRFVWQRAEEIFTAQSGGARLVEEGVTSGILCAHGLHISSTMPSGEFFSRPGIMMANAAHINMEISCIGGHVMSPDKGSNAIDIATDIHVAMRNFCIRVLGPNKPTAFIPSVSTAGIKPSIMPDKVNISYSMRNFLDPSNLHEFFQKLKRHIQSIVSAYEDASLDAFCLLPGFPALSNDHVLHGHTSDVLETAGLKTDKCHLLFCGEDFSYYAQRTPGSFWMLGAKQGPGFDHHTSYFNPDENALWKGVAYWIALATA